jgi:hypothetical protein
MIIEVTLGDHHRPKWRMKQCIWNVDASEVAGIAQAQGPKGVRGLVSDIISKKLPTNLSHLEVMDWAFVDQGALS